MGQPPTTGLTACEEALTAHDGRRRLMARTLDWITRFVPATVAAYHGVDQRSRLAVADPLVYKLLPPNRFDAAGALRAYQQRYSELDPLSPLAFREDDATVVSVQNVGGGAAFAASPFARGFLAPLDLGPVTCVFLRDETRIVAAVRLVRNLGEPAHSEVHLEFLRRSQPLLQDAYLVARQAEADDPTERLRDSGLTGREIEVALMVASGARNEEIARALTVSEATVKTHLHRVFTKLGVRSRTQLALQLGRSATFG